VSGHGTHQADLFAGKTYDPSLDKERLAKLARAVYEVMIDGKWRTYRQIQTECVIDHQVQGSEGGIGARLRDFRKDAFGNHHVERRRREPASSGIFEYQLTDPKNPNTK